MGLELAKGDSALQKTALTEKIRSLGEEIGLDALGVAAAAPFSDYALRDSSRRDPRISMPNARTIIVAGIYIGGLTLPKWEAVCYGRTSRLYLSGFFLDVVKPLLPIIEFLKQVGYQALACDGAVRGGSVLPLKLAAVRAGLGWQGKHSLLISKTYGTFLALGGIITDAEMNVNTRIEPNRCRECDQCRTACPLGALERPHVLDMQRCLSYRLQEEDLPAAAEAVMENRVGDCEICQTACPWNKKHLKTPLDTKLTAAFQKRIDALESLFHLPHLMTLSAQDYREHLGHLNTEIPFDLFRRNVRLALQHATAEDSRACE